MARDEASTALSNFQIHPRRSWPTKDFSKSAIGLHKLFFVEISKLLRPLVKMARIGVLTRVLFSLILSYTDLGTDVLVCRDYWNTGRTRLAYASGGCIAFALFVQAVITFYQYRVRGGRLVGLGRGYSEYC